MSGDVTRILSRIESGDPQAADELLPLVYDELRRLAAAKLRREKPGQTLQATALVHEAYVRLVDSSTPRHYANHRHFFLAAAEAMRRILVNRARDKDRLKRGGSSKRVNVDITSLSADDDPFLFLEFNEAFEKLVTDDPLCGDLAKLRIFAGLSASEAAKAMNIPRRTADRYWAYARAWLYDCLTSVDLPNAQNGGD